jgi:hypothetical protein
MRASPPARRLRRFSEEHLGYEIDMLLAATAALAAPRPQGFAMNALVEVFGVHLRLLIAFVYDEPRRDDDVSAEDYVADVAAWRRARRAMPRALKAARARIDKQIMHLTFKRYRGSAPQKRWTPQRLTSLLVPALRTFREHAARGRLHPGVAQRLDAL